MNSQTLSNDIISAATVHLNVLDEFIATVQTKLDENSNPFVRDSLSDLLSSLRDQREGYSLFAAPALAAV